MRDPDILVIGGGPAGMSAALEAARSGLAVELVEQRESLGGAIYRQPIEGVQVIPQSAGARGRWAALSQAFSKAAIPVRFGSVFLGVDGHGYVLVENRQNGLVECLSPRAVVLATGAVEHVHPRPGWQFAGVSTAGGLQVMMKETGTAPRGSVLLAGSGPLLIAVAAQMARLGNPPLAIVESGDPYRRIMPGLSMLGFPKLLAEALGYLKDIHLHRIPWLRGSRLVRIERQGERFSAVVRAGDGSQSTFVCDRIGLHDGIRPNDYGLPQASSEAAAGPVILRAGDCREALGAIAAEADGRRAGRLAIQGVAASAADDIGKIDRQRRAQALLARLFAPVDDRSALDELADDTLLCRCEGKTVGDLRNLCQRVDSLTGREVKHNGRFAMGACQGRFCAANTAALMARFKPEAPASSAADLTGRRWPVRPVSIGALVRAASRDNDTQ
ncbi:FAD-dependent oxidoreductase [Hoeflea alexandrii]|uniref:FAD-dependent oxidoreductase n=1 Tax=Hoeflea alexandrii TaxID=288436 RepID=UPI0022B01E52|nr:FAD-dependent oxidoreductase [Hoeflea alexandrii]MCZ4290761.1 FAD-dependent oxidoreductase [Hoeflea alexandrii]